MSTLENFFHPDRDSNSPNLLWSSQRPQKRACHPCTRALAPALSRCPPIPAHYPAARHRRRRRRRCCCCCQQAPPSHRIGIEKKRDGYRTSVSTKIASVSNLCMNPNPLSPPSFFTTGQRFLKPNHVTSAFPVTSCSSDVTSGSGDVTSGMTFVPYDVTNCARDFS